MSRISIGYSNSRPRTGNKTLRRCRNKEEADNVILIDVDPENCDNVVIIDIPDSLTNRNQDPLVLKKDKKWSFRNVINIDDDDTPDNSRPFGTSNIGFAARTSLDRESFHVSKDFRDSTDASGKDCQFVQDSAKPVRLSKCKRTYSGKASTGNCYGLETDSDYDSSSNDGNDYPDCELVEDSSGKVQEMWEKAVSRRRKDIHSVHSDIRGHTSTSNCIRRDCQNAESKNATTHHNKASFGETTRKPNGGNHGGSTVGEENDVFGFTHLFNGPLNVRGGESQAKYHPSIHVDLADDQDCEEGSSSSHDERRNSVSSNFSLQEEQGKKLNHPISTCRDNQNSKEEGTEVQLQTEIGCSSSPVGACVIGEREKLKETDEYKKAMEEEWASRQQAIQIQAEAAQHERRLRKRQNAESMRLLAMEKRQKQRLEEMRSIEKKDEENMNLKDKIRSEVQNQLKKMEVGCKNMASLLQFLGVKVGSWPNQSPQEVQAAYKRALLTFHPDRASQSDIRQLVEAEEKFKLINRMKEKFPTS